MELVERCASCAARDCVFFHTGSDGLEVLHHAKRRGVCAAGASLFVEGQAPRGLFVLCAGRVKVSASSPAGRSVIVRVAGPGDVLGLSAVIRAEPFDVSARALELTQFGFIPRDEFLRGLADDRDLALRVARHLSAEVRRAYQQVSRIALAPSARAKLASLLLEWIGDQPGRSEPTPLRLQMLLTHEEIGELIGCTRETIARLLAEFRRERLIESRGRFITVPDRGRLEAVAGSTPGVASFPHLVAG